MCLAHDPNSKSTILIICKIEPKIYTRHLACPRIEMKHKLQPLHHIESNVMFLALVRQRLSKDRLDKILQFLSDYSKGLNLSSKL